VTTKQIAQLKGWIEVGTNTFMPKKTFEKYSFDKELTSEEKQKLFNSGDRHPKLYEALKARKKQVHKRPTNGSEKTKQQPQETATRSWSEEELKELNPVWIDERLEKIKHLHPQQLDNRRDEVWK
jgi:transketolase